MIKPPKISIVTPSFNQGEFLEECIDSVLSQNYPNLEYIIMDGGSTDKSVEIIKKYEKYLTYWQSKPDSGQHDAINEGFKRSTGEIMAWLNSDDKYHHHAFFKIAYIFSKFKDIEWIIGRQTKWDKDGQLSWIFLGDLPRFSREKYFVKNYKDPYIQQESTFWKRSLWEKAGSRIRTDLEYAGDLELWMRFFRFAQLYIVDTFLGGYREHGNQKANLFMDRYIEEADEILDEEMKLFQQGEYTDVLSAPEPITISHRELKSYIDNIHSYNQNQIYKISDDSDLVIDLLMKKVNDPESATITLAVFVLRKLYLYNFYLRHPKYFSLTYHLIRKFLGIFSRKQKK